ncbi:head-tail connector protein [Clostridium sp. FP1]|uniref:head-tail connector protein n=1 Tax=Clostridium sp. FP1 TaxID=2724076 RepID=UPI0013E985DE|nr:head-tail connector protein [Clostridium sp. FP1]MBZ9635503.1 head-tail connector protein [Clostridium sp. FP1]
MINIKISQVTLIFVRDYLRLDQENDDSFISLCMSSSLAFIKGKTALTIEEIDQKEDLTMAYLVLIADMFDTRSYVVEKDKINKIVDCILEMHRRNFL